MGKARLEAFSDGVIAILITIMVLELKTPAGVGIDSLLKVGPTLSAYVLSFVFLGIYWTNHHHLFHATGRVSGLILWANLHLLFWLSLIPFVTAWMGEYHRDSLPTSVYGVVQLCAAIAWTILRISIVKLEGPHSKLASAVGSDTKGKISLALYASAVPLAFFKPWISQTLYVVVALMWLVPDRRIERRFQEATAR